MRQIQKTSSDTIFWFAAFLGFTTIHKCKATPIYPILKDPWSREGKIAFLSQQNYNQVSSGYCLSLNVKNSKFNFGIIGKTDPYEPLNSLAFSRFYFRYKYKNTAFILGSYRIQLGEGIMKSIGTPSYLNNPAWANKSEEWNIKEYRGFSRNFPVLGIAGKSNLSKKYHLIYSFGKAKLSGKIENNRVVNWNKTGLLTDSTKLGQKNNFFCLTSTTAVRYQNKCITAGLGIHSYAFSLPVKFTSTVNIAETAWYNYYRQKANSNDSISQDYNYYGNFIQQLHATEFWLTQSCKNGNLLFINAIKQIKQPVNNQDNNPVVRTNRINYCSNSQYYFQDIPKQFALISGLLIPLNKLNDVGVQFKYVGSEFESVENLETQQMKGFNSMQIAVQNQLSPRLQISTSYLLQRKVSFNQLNQKPWEKILRCKIQYQQSNTVMKSVLKLSQRESAVNRESSMSELSVQEEIENSIHPADLEQLDVFWQQTKTPTILQLHTEIQLRQNHSTTTEFHSYIQNCNKQNSSCLEFSVNKQWHTTVQSQSGIALFNTSAPLVVQGLQLGSINSFQIVNNQGLFLFMGIKHKPGKELTQLLQLQIMQNFNPQRPISVRIFAVIWLR